MADKIKNSKLLIQKGEKTTRLRNLKTKKIVVLMKLKLLAKERIPSEGKINFILDILIC